MQSSSSSAMIDKYQMTLDASGGRGIGEVIASFDRIEGYSCKQLSAKYKNRFWWLPQFPNLLYRPFESNKQHDDGLPLCFCVYPQGQIPTECGNQCIEWNDDFFFDYLDLKWPRCLFVNGVLVQWAADEQSSASNQSASPPEYWASDDQYSTIEITATTSGIDARDFVVVYDGIEYRNPVDLEPRTDPVNDPNGTGTPWVNCAFEVMSDDGDVLCVFPWRCDIYGTSSVCSYKLPRSLFLQSNGFDVTVLPQVGPSGIPQGQIYNNIRTVSSEWPDLGSTFTQWSTNPATLESMVGNHSGVYSLFFAGGGRCCYFADSYDTGRFSDPVVYPPPYPYDAGLTDQDFPQNWTICFDRLTERNPTTNALDPNEVPYLVITVVGEAIPGEGPPQVYGNNGPLQGNVQVIYKKIFVESDILGETTFTVPQIDTNFPYQGSASNQNKWVTRTPFAISNGTVTITLPIPLEVNA